MSQIPDGWTVSAVGDVTSKPSKVDPVSTGRQTVRYVDIGLLDGAVDNLTSAPEVASADAPSRCRQVVAGGDTLYSTVRPYLRKIAYVSNALDQEFASTGYSVLRARPAIDPKYLYYFCHHPSSRTRSCRSRRASAIPRSWIERSAPSRSGSQRSMSNGGSSRSSRTTSPTSTQQRATRPLLLSASTHSGRARLPNSTWASLCPCPRWLGIPATARPRNACLTGPVPQSYEYRTSSTVTSTSPTRNELPQRQQTSPAPCSRRTIY